MLTVVGVGLLVTMRITTRPRRHAIFPHDRCCPHTAGRGVRDGARPAGAARVRHTLPVVMSVAAAAVVAGAKSLFAIGEWVAELDREASSQLGIEPMTSVAVGVDDPAVSTPSKAPTPMAPDRCAPASSRGGSLNAAQRTCSSGAPVAPRVDGARNLGVSGVREVNGLVSPLSLVRL